MKNLPYFLAEDLIKGLLSFFFDFDLFILLPDLLIMELIGEELHGVIVMTQQLVVPIDLVSESTFLSNQQNTAPSLMSSTGV
jgi:hypothetical protein